MSEHANRQPQQLSWTEDGPPSPTLSASEAAALADVSVRRVQKWAQAEVVAATKDSKNQWHIERQSLETHLARRRPQAPPATPRASPHPALPPHASHDALRGEIRRLQDLLALVQQELALAREREQWMWRLLEGTQIPVGPLGKPAPTVPTPATPQGPEPDPQTLLGRVLAYLRAEGRPKQAWQVAEALGLDKRPARALSTLLEKGFVLRPKPAMYLARPLGSPPNAASPGGGATPLREDADERIATCNKV